MKKQCIKVQPKFKPSLRFSNDANCVQKGEALNYCFSVSLGIETWFNLRCSKSCFNARMKSYNCLKLEHELITSSFLKLRTTVALLFFEQCRKVQPKFKPSLRFVNDGNCVKNGGALTYCFGVFLGIKIRFNLIYYKTVSMHE